jgi:hypothetical protein
MATKNERYVNITLQNDDKKDKNDVVISISGFLKSLRKYLLIWIVAAVVAASVLFAGNVIFSQESYKNLSALVCFTYDGIEEGLDPDGNSFDVNTLKSPSVIESALTELNQPLTLVETIRQSISIEGIIPSDAIDRITAYKSVYENAQSGALSAAQAMLDVKYYPTQYKVIFNYSSSGLSNSEAVDIFNTMLECYRDYFFNTYGYNRALGSAVTALDYTDYDYAEAIDVFSNTLSTLSSYVDSLADDDTTRFRSSTTGYTFSDLSEAINTLSSVDLDVISSYITVNNVTKDKDSLIDYYQYRIESLTRDKAIAQDSLDTLTETINNYEKDQIIIFGNGTEDTNTQSTVASEEYDKLIQQKINAQKQLSTDTQQISYYNQRISALKGKTAASDEKVARVEEDLAALSDKVNTLIDSVNDTANEYYEKVSFANAYSILVPASTSSINELRNAIDDSVKPIIVAEALIFAVYVMFAFIESLIKESNLKKSEKAAKAAAEEAESDDDDDDDDESESK